MVLEECVGVAECLWSCGGAERGYYGLVVCADSFFEYVVDDVCTPCEA